MMPDDQVLLEIEKRIKEWFVRPGWAEENAGFRQVQEWITELRGQASLTNQVS